MSKTAPVSANDQPRAGAQTHRQNKYRLAPRCVSNAGKSMTANNKVNATSALS
ncbi:hypothetical protein FHX58_005741 [Paraburkholderia tropica]|nr:hypothetical protein [Paraburkholderia tropica]